MLLSEAEERLARNRHVLDVPVVKGPVVKGVTKGAKGVVTGVTGC